jgi:hypothetical protein
MKPRFVCLAIVLAACRSGEPVADHSHAADGIIDNAKTREERAELTRVRDEVDAAAQARISKLNDEIERLEKENAELRKR